MPVTPRKPRVVHFDLAVLFSESASKNELSEMADDIVHALRHYWENGYNSAEYAVGVLVTPPEGIPQYGVNLDHENAFCASDPGSYGMDFLDQLDQASLSQAIQYFQELPEQKDEPHPWLLTFTNGEQ